ncbi:hypothetical protein [Collimonas sp. PA-H2]|uniref:hypothetical protein n=1 Tax=Collimonas sp. PA-H2 TaxID=1881062 RepID=UPI00117DC8C3|nr:hypothetical protein [Collimonas sp. PA-H2]
MFVFSVSWGLAYLWSIHGSWWLAHCPKLIVTAIYITARPVLSSEAWEAEEQLEFLFFWVPIFIALIWVIFLYSFAGKIFRTKGARIS